MRWEIRWASYSGYIHLLRSPDVTDAERADYLNRLEHETERMKNTIGDLLDFAQPSSQEITELQLNDIVHDICAMIACHKEFKNIRDRAGSGRRAACRSRQ